MIGRALLSSAAVASIVAMLGVAMRPLLADGHDGDPLPMRQSATAVGPDSAAVATAIDTAVAALRCPTPESLRPGCGRLAVADAAGYLSGPGQAMVRLTGALSAAGGPPLPVALQVRLTNTGGRWSAAVVTP